MSMNGERPTASHPPYREHAAAVDAAQLEADLRRVVHGEVRFDRGSRALYATAEERALKSMGLQVDVLESGCCGMAGSFGFERDHYDVSMKVGERVLLPAVRQAPKDVLIVADGFSCRTQIAQATDRRALRLADLLEMAVTDGASGPEGDYPESRYVPEYEVPPARSAVVIGGVLAGAALGAAGVAMWRRR